jgi:lactate dehydrogenase-like 2-hydroxyacid dehydrogenase
VADRPRVVVARTLPAAGIGLLEERFDVDAGQLRIDLDDLRRRIAGAAALVADPTVPVDGPLLDAAGPSLRVVANFAVGYDNVDLEACRERGVTFTNTPDVLTNATAELAVALMLATARRLGEAERMLRAGDWRGWDPGQLLGRELAECRIGIVGLGRIGCRVAELLRGFGSPLGYWSRSRRPEAERELELQYMEQDELFGESDVVTLHVALTDQTRHMIDAAALERFKPGAILVNTARGGLVDSEALAAALRDGRLGGAGLDVFEYEPAVPPELLELENAVLVPHIGSATSTARNAMATLAARNVIAVLAGDEPLTPVVHGTR